MLLTGGGVGPYFSGGNILPFALLALIGPIIVFCLNQTTSVAAQRQRFLWITGLCVVLVIGMTARQLAVRSGESVAGIHDGAVQAEVAADKLLHGQNPYGADYRGTDYERLNPPITGGPTINVVWSHVIYPPFVFESFVPFAWLRGLLGPLADYRMLTVGALLLAAWLLAQQAASWEERARVVALTLGNPLLWMYAVIGTNDGMAAALVIISIALLVRNRWWWGGFVFALAVATKQSVWLLLPLWFFWAWRQGKTASNGRRNLTYGWLAGIVVTFGPFLLWHPQRMITDILSYASGSIPYSYPVSGTTFLQYLTIWHMIPSPWAVFPTYAFQLIVWVPALWFVCRWLRKQWHVSRWLIGAAVLTLSTLLVGRYMNNNYLVAPMLLVIAGYVWPDTIAQHD